MAEKKTAQADNNHRIRITLTSRNPQSLEKGANDRAGRPSRQALVQQPPQGAARAFFSRLAVLPRAPFTSTY